MNVGTFNFTALLECVYEADQEATILDQAVEMLKDAYQKKDMQELVGVAIAVLAFVQGIKQTEGICKEVDPSSWNMSTFNMIKDNIENPILSMRMYDGKIMFNALDITSEMEASFETLRAGDFYGFGQSYGALLKNNAEPHPTLFLS